MYVHLTLLSHNAKTGPIPVSTTSSDTCPDTCPFKNNGCYAQSGPLAIHWKAVDNGRGGNWQEFLTQVRHLPKHQLWRHNQAGDLPGKGNRINARQLRALAMANRGRNGFTYTHKPMTPANARAVREANTLGFTVNLSSNSLAEADVLLATGAGPVVTVVPHNAPAAGKTPGGRKYVTCPAQLRDDMNCARCGLCQDRSEDRPVIAFRAHGTGRKKIEALLMEETV